MCDTASKIDCPETPKYKSTKTKPVRNILPYWLGINIKANSAWEHKGKRYNNTIIAPTTLRFHIGTMVNFDIATRLIAPVCLFFP
jgi:hypothetical protein